MRGLKTPLIVYLFYFQVWANFKEEEPVKVVEEPVERKVNFTKVVVTEVTDDLTFYAQNVDDGESQLQMG